MALVERGGHTADTGVEQWPERAELRGEAVAGVHGGGLTVACDGKSERRVLAHERHGAGPRRDRVDRLGERHADHRADWVAGATGPARRLQLGGKGRDLRGVEDLCELPHRRRRWYLRNGH